MESFIENISDIGNDKNQSKGYYHRLTDYLEDEGILNEEDCHELVNRIESFIEQEIREIRLENLETYYG
tara:strand:- start:944 stop:1150 length:207 start_codon:yes stop_codon:yes gene_type:complete